MEKEIFATLAYINELQNLKIEGHMLEIMAREIVKKVIPKTTLEDLLEVIRPTE